MIFLLLLASAGIHGSLILNAAPEQTAKQPPKQELIRFEESLDAMGTTYTVVLYGRDRWKLQAAVETAFEEVRRIDGVLSNYRKDSEWSLLNREAASRAVVVSPETFSLLEACLRYSEASEGAFDITVAPLMKIWGFYKGSGKFPHRAEVRGALTKVGSRNIQLDAKARTVRFSRSGVEIDPGGVGKGYAVDRAAAILKQAGVTSGLINAGSSSVYAIGSPPEEPQGWKLEIRHPKDQSRNVTEVYLRNQSMSTSGNYEKFFRVRDRLYSHIMDPRTGYPAEGMFSVSIISPRTLDSEVWAKPYYVNGRKWAAAHQLKDSRAFLCEDRSEPEPSCAWLQ